MHQKISFLFFLSLILLNSSSWGSRTIFPHASSFSMEDVEKWIQPSGKAQSVEGLLAQLPENYRSYFVLQYESNSLHEATPDHPRIIFFGPDARILTAVSSYPNDERYQVMEFIEYLEKEARFEFYQLHFEENRTPTLIRGSDDCTRCHSNDPRPNWEPYSLWPGTYGGLHDRIPYGNAENRKFESFVNSFEKSPRFRALVQPFYGETLDFSGKPSYHFMPKGQGGSSTLTILLNYLNRDRIAKQIVGSPHFEELREATTAALIGCPEDPEFYLPSFGPRPSNNFSDRVTDTREKAVTDYDRRLRKQAKVLETEDIETVRPHSDDYGLRDSEIRRIAALRYLYEDYGSDIEVDRWTLSLYKTSYAFNDGINGIENLIGQYLPLAYESNDPLLKSIPLREVDFPITDYGSLKDPFPLLTYTIQGDPTEACNILKNRVGRSSVGQKKLSRLLWSRYFPTQLFGNPYYPGY